MPIDTTLVSTVIVTCESDDHNWTVDTSCDGDFIRLTAALESHMALSFRIHVL